MFEGDFLGNAYRDLEGGAWAHIHPDLCPCDGGWLLSDFDTLHRCPLHHEQGVPHRNPDEWTEGDRQAAEAYDWKAYGLRQYRKAWIAYRRRSGLPAKEFRRRAERVLSETRGATASPRVWVDAAQEVAEEARLLRQERGPVR